MSNKIRTFKEDSNFKDSINLLGEHYSPNEKLIRGIAIIKDENGNVLTRKENTVVARGRLFSLEHVFNLELDSTNPDMASFIKNRKRSVCLVGIGSGGTLPGDWWNPVVVQPWETDMANPVPFRTFSEGIDNIEQGLDKVYYGKHEVDKGPDGVPAIQYYLKRMNANNTDFKPEWYVDKATNSIAVKNTVLIDKYDARGEKINEMGFYLAGFDAASNTFSDIELFSRVTFDTESLSGNKSLTVEYYVFC